MGTVKGSESKSESESVQWKNFCIDLVQCNHRISNQSSNPNPQVVCSGGGYVQEWEWGSVCPGVGVGVGISRG